MNRLLMCRSFVAAALVAAVATPVAGQDRKPGAARPAGPDAGCWALVGNESPEFERGHENPLILAGKPTGWTVVLWLNGDPLGFYGDGAVVWPLYGGLRTGTNELTISGRHDRPVYVVIAGGRPGGKAAVVAGKRKFDAPGAAARAAPLLFPVARAAKLPEREHLGDRPRERARQEKEARALVAELRRLVAGHKGREAVRLLNEGLLLRARAEGDSGPDRERLEKYARKITDPAARVVNGDRSVGLLFGRRAVLVYGRPPDGAGKDRSLFTIQSGRHKLTVGPLQLARVGGRWVVWSAR